MRDYNFFLAETFIGQREFESHHSIPSYDEIVKKHCLFLVCFYSPIYRKKRPIFS